MQGITLKSQQGAHKRNVYLRYSVMINHQVSRNAIR